MRLALILVLGLLAAPTRTLAEGNFDVMPPCTGGHVVEPSGTIDVPTNLPGFRVTADVTAHLVGPSGPVPLEVSTGTYPTIIRILEPLAENTRYVLTTETVGCPSEEPSRQTLELTTGTFAPEPGAGELGELHAALYVTRREWSPTPVTLVHLEFEMSEAATRWQPFAEMKIVARQRGVERFGQIGNIYDGTTYDFEIDCDEPARRGEGPTTFYAQGVHYVGDEMPSNASVTMDIRCADAIPVDGYYQPLTPEEWAMMNAHADAGMRMDGGRSDAAPDARPFDAADGDAVDAPMVVTSGSGGCGVASKSHGAGAAVTIALAALITRRRRRRR